MQALEDLKKRLSDNQTVPWDQLPDFPLYMDQLISYMPRQVLALDREERLTSAMVNNYIKEGLLPRAHGKRYTREHIVYLTAICVLKQVLTVKELGQLLPGLDSETDVQEYYSRLFEVIDSELAATGELIDVPDGAERELADLALHLAVSAYSRQYLCKKIIENLAQDSKRQKKGSK